METQTEKQLSEQDLSEGELVDQPPLEAIETPPSRLAGNNLIPDFGADRAAGTLQGSSERDSNN